MAKREEYSYAREGNYSYFGEYEGGVTAGIGLGADWNKLAKYVNPLESALISGGSVYISDVFTSVEGLPIYLTDGTVGTPGLAWQNDRDSALYRLGSQNFGWSVAAALKYDWNATRFKLASGFSLDITDMTSGSVLFAGSGGRVSQNNASFFWDNASLTLLVGSTSPYGGLSSAIQSRKTYTNTGIDVIDFASLPTFPTDSTAWLYGLLSSPTGTGSGANGRILSVYSSPRWAGSSTLAQLNGFENSSLIDGGGTVTTSRGLYLKTPDIASGTIVDNYGIFLDNHIGGSNNYGIYVAGAGTYAIWVDSGTCRFDGSVGIGTTGPDRKLDVLDTSVQMRWTYTDGSVYTDCETTSAGHTKLVNTGGLFGLGVTPTTTLHVKGLTGTNTYVTSDAFASTLQAAFAWSQAGSQIWIAYVPGSSTDLRFYDGTGDRVKFMNGGNVYIAGELELDGALNHDGTTVGLYAATPAVQGTGGQNVTNSVTDSGSTAGTIPDITDGTTYANDYTNLRRALYQLARMLKQDHDQLRAMGILT